MLKLCRSVPNVVIFWLSIFLTLATFILICRNNPNQQNFLLEKVHKAQENIVAENRRKIVNENKIVNSVIVNSAQNVKPSCQHMLKNLVLRCLLKRLEFSNQFWTDFTPAIEGCSGFLKETLPIKQIDNWDDQKYIIMPIGYTEQSKNETECFTMTLGIGNDITVELELKRIFPKCQFVGIDPMYEAGKVFSKIGLFWNYAVGKPDEATGLLEASVFKNQYYFMENVTSLPFGKVLEQTKTDLIDFLLVDAEGAEYNVIPVLERSKLNKLEICQMAIEIHGFDAIYHTTETEFKKMIISLLKNGDFLPIIGSPPPGFNRMFWMNFGSPKCIEKYLSGFC